MLWPARYIVAMSDFVNAAADQPTGGSGTQLLGADVFEVGLSLRVPGDRSREPEMLPRVWAGLNPFRLPVGINDSLWRPVDAQHYPSAACTAEDYSGGKFRLCLFSASSEYLREPRRKRAREP